MDLEAVGVDLKTWISVCFEFAFYVTFEIFYLRWESIFEG